MPRRLTAVWAALAALSMLVLAPGTATAQGLGSIRIGGAEILLQSFDVQVLTVTGNAVCALTGLVTIEVATKDLATGGLGEGTVEFECTYPDEHVQWAAGVGAEGHRPGDRILVEATAVGAIVDEDERVVTLKQFR